MQGAIDMVQMQLTRLPLLEAPVPLEAARAAIPAAPLPMLLAKTPADPSRSGTGTTRV